MGAVDQNRFGESRDIIQTLVWIHFNFTFLKKWKFEKSNKNISEVYMEKLISRGSAEVNLMIFYPSNRHDSGMLYFDYKSNHNGEFRDNRNLKSA
jgi:hypothetical protein